MCARLTAPAAPRCRRTACARRRTAGGRAAWPPAVGQGVAATGGQWFAACTWQGAERAGGAWWLISCHCTAAPCQGVAACAWHEQGSKPGCQAALPRPPGPSPARPSWAAPPGPGNRRGNEGRGRGSVGRGARLRGAPADAWRRESARRGRGGAPTSLRGAALRSSCSMMTLPAGGGRKGAAKGDASVGASGRCVLLTAERI